MNELNISAVPRHWVYRCIVLYEIPPLQACTDSEMESIQFIFDLPVILTILARNGRAVHNVYCIRNVSRRIRLTNF